MDYITEDDLIVMSAAAMKIGIEGDKDVNDACQRIAAAMAFNKGEIVVKRSHGKLSPAALAAIGDTREMLVRMIMSRGGMV